MTELGAGTVSIRPVRRASWPLSLHAGLTAIGGFLILLVILPVGSLLVTTFQQGIAGFIDPLLSPIGAAALILSVVTGLVAAAINTVAGSAIAFALTRGRFPGRTVLNALVDLPLAIPTTVSGLMLVLLYSPVHPFGQWLTQHHIGLAYTRASIVLAMVFVTLPYAIRTIQPLIESLDGRLEEAAWTLGASRWRTLFRVVVPSVLPGIITGFFLTFSRAIAEFGTVVIVSGNLPLKTQVASVYLYGLVENDDPTGAAAVSVVMLVISLVALGIPAWLGGRSRRQGAQTMATVPIKSVAAHENSPVKWLLALFAWLWIGVILILPVGNLASGALGAGWSGLVQSVMQPQALSALRLSAVVTLWTVGINLVFGVWAAVLFTRHTFPGRKIMLALADLPFSLSPVIAGLVLLFVYGPTTPIGHWLQQRDIHLVYSTPGMVMASVLVTFPLMVRELIPMLETAGVKQEEAAFTLGASRWRTFWRITMPAIRWSIIYGLVLTIARSLGEFGAVLIVSGNLVGMTQTATLYVYQATVNHDMPSADAISLLLAAASFVILIIVQGVQWKRGARVEH
ncbi:MAG: sulfate ABC transporter permease subunit [Alicyclobacillus sp.]|nr:sulfate ABC transporter permease subunit [Alicyclobacillus sp.]